MNKSGPNDPMKSMKKIMQANETSCKRSLKYTTIENKKTKSQNALGKPYKLDILAHPQFISTKHDKQEKTKRLECYSKAMQVVILLIRSG